MSLDLSDGQWYDFWHTHPDMMGRSNLNGKHRREHLRVLFRMFERVVAQSGNHPHPFQTWLEIDAVDGSQDALYFHTPNPNHLRCDPPLETFPNNFEGVKWDVNPPNLFAQFVDHSRLSVGVGNVMSDNGAARPYYYVRMR